MQAMGDFRYIFDPVQSLTAAASLPACGPLTGNEQCLPCDLRKSRQG